MNDLQFFILSGLIIFWMGTEWKIYLSERNHRRWLRNTINSFLEYLHKQRFFEKNPL